MASRMLPDTFPAKAYLMIDNCSVEHPNVASWTADGTAFVVKDSAQLATYHLPRYFKHSISIQCAVFKVKLCLHQEDCSQLFYQCAARFFLQICLHKGFLPSHKNCV